MTLTAIPLTYKGLCVSLVEEHRGWTVEIPRFGKTMYCSSKEAALVEAMRLIDAFILPRMLREDSRAA
jgi:hypothetical protein